MATKKVCKQLFLSTLNIREWSFYNWVTNSSQGCIPPNESQRTTNQMARQLSATAIKNRTGGRRNEFSMSFNLSSLPNMESHYCRSSTSKKYLDPIWRSQA